MVTVEEAEQIVCSQLREYGRELLPFEEALGRVLAEDLYCDRDLPPYDRITMDGIAVNFDAISNGIRVFKVKEVQAAGDVPASIDTYNECIEVMTGATLPLNADSIIPYENLNITDGVARIINEPLKHGQYIHKKGIDRKQGEIVLHAGRVIDPAVINIAATIGHHQLWVKKSPRIVVISTGNEVVDVTATPSPYQVRKSNSYTIKAILKQYGIIPAILHLDDDPVQINLHLRSCLEHYDAIIITGGVSMGKFDYIPAALQSLEVKELFHKVRQRPGKPFWFGAHPMGTLVFAFPGNPVSSFMCMYRYFIPWLLASWGITKSANYAMLSEDFTFHAPLQYFLQVRLSMNTTGQQLAAPLMGNGSGDLANLADADAFMELPLQQNEFKKGEAFRIWKYNNLFY